MKKMSAIVIFAVLLLGAAAAVYAVDYSTPSQASVRIKSTRYDPFPVEPGSYFDVWIRVENFGGADIQNFKFKLDPEYPFSLDPNEEAQRDFGLLNSGGQALFKFKVRADINAVEGENPLAYEFSISGADWNRAQLNINVHTMDAILAIEDVVSEKEVIAPGDKTSIEIKLKNMADSILKNVNVKLNLVEVIQTGATFQVKELPISPLGSSDEKTIKVIEGGEETSVKFDLIVDSSAESKVYKIPLTITYNDMQGTNYSKNNIISVLVGSAPDVAITVDSSTANMVGKVGDVVVKFVNKGFSEIKFLYVTLDETDNFELVSPSEVYLGNVDSDDYESAEFKIYVKDSPNGEINLPLMVSYKDTNNKHYKEEIILKTRIYSSSRAKKLGLAEGSSSVGIIVVIVIAGGGFYLYRKYKKKRKK